MKQISLLLQVLIVLSCCVLLSAGFVVQLNANDEACFHEDLKINDRMGVTFEVGSGGNFDVDFRIVTPTSRTLHEGLREKSNTYTFTAEENGQYSYCFSNKMSIRAKKTVTFSVVAMDQTQNQPSSNESTQSGTDFEKEVRELLNSLRTVKDSQQYLRTRERTHRDTAESTNTRVQWWSIFQVAILFVVCVFQIFYLRSSFEIKQTV